MRQSLPLVLIFALSSTALAQPTPGDLMMDKYLAAETDKLSAKFLDGAKTLDEWTTKRPRLRREYLDMLGLWPLPEKSPLKVTVTKTFEIQGATIDNLHFQSRPGLYVTANLYRPKGNTKKLPTILYVCGHSNRGRDGNKSAHQDQGLWFANNGYNCLVVDTLQLGEIPGIHHGTYRFDRWWWHSAGYSPAAVECWNGIRAIDYLFSRSDVDLEKLGVTGISGGGAVTIWIAAADERVKVAVPVSGMSDLQSYVKNKIINGHCDCMFLYNTYQWEWTTILALIAPRPLLFANSDKDPIFPMDANRRIATKMRTIYGMYDKPLLTDEYVSPGGHAYRPDLRVAIFKFLNKHLKGDTTSPVQDSASFQEIPAKDLRVFPTDADLPNDVLNAKIDETFVPRARIALPTSGEFESLKTTLIRRLRAEVFRPLPAEMAAATLKSAKAEHTQDAETEPGISTWVYDGGGTDTLLISGFEKMTFAERNAWMARHVPDGADFFSPRGLITNAWSKKSPPNTIERSHILLGQTVDQKRVFDIIAMAKAQSKKAKLAVKGEVGSIKLVGTGEMGILGTYAALLDSTIGAVTLHNPPTSHMKGPHLPGVLRVLDIPEALGLLAPRPLTIIGDDPAFDRTAEIYRLAGAAEKLTRKKSN